MLTPFFDRLLSIYRGFSHFFLIQRICLIKLELKKDFFFWIFSQHGDPYM